MLEISELPNNVVMLPGIANRAYFQNSETKEFWFHATDVCKVLGYTNVTSAISLHCDDDEKLQEIWNGKATWFVSEAGCYGLAMGAKNEIAKKFKRWLKHEVLKKLRASGGYIMPTATSSQLEALQAEITTLQQANTEKQKLLLKTLLMGQDIRGCTPSLVFKNLAHMFPEMCFNTGRKKNIMTIYNATGRRYLAQNDTFTKYEDFIQFLKCVGQGYYLDGVGGSGECKKLQHLLVDW